MVAAACWFGWKKIFGRRAVASAPVQGPAVPEIHPLHQEEPQVAAQVAQLSHEIEQRQLQV